jgi:hypothetical protein
MFSGPPLAAHTVMRERGVEEERGRMREGRRGDGRRERGREGEEEKKRETCTLTLKLCSIGCCLPMATGLPSSLSC